VIEATVRPDLYVDGDPSQLYQVVMNLLVNARDAIDGAGVVRLELAGSGKEVALTVSDNGRGMDEATKNRIFEPFFTTKREGVGFGIGLSTVHDIVSTLAGAIEVESQLGSGSTFRIRLRAVKPLDHRFRQRTVQRLNGRHRSTEGHRLVLVDDEVVLQRSLARVLRRVGYEVETFESGERALERLDEPPLADLVILDLDLPGMRGQD